MYLIAYIYSSSRSTCVVRYGDDRVRRFATDPVVMRSSPATDILYVVHCWLISPNKLNLYFRSC